jgi:hypothetical protein
MGQTHLGALPRKGWLRLMGTIVHPRAIVVLIGMCQRQDRLAGTDLGGAGRQQGAVSPVAIQLRSQRQLDVEGEDPGVRMRRCRAWADVILDAGPEKQ